MSIFLTAIPCNIKVVHPRLLRDYLEIWEFMPCWKWRYLENFTVKHHDNLCLMFARRCTKDIKLLTFRSRRQIGLRAHFTIVVQSWRYKRTVKFARCVHRPDAFNMPRDRDPRDRPLSFSSPKATQLLTLRRGPRRLTSATTPREVIARRSNRSQQLGDAHVIDHHIINNADKYRNARGRLRNDRWHELIAGRVHPRTCTFYLQVTGMCVNSALFNWSWLLVNNMFVSEHRLHFYLR